MKIGFRRVLATVAALLALPAAAGAACSQADLTGRWTLAVDTLGIGGGSATDIFSLTCTMTLQDNGRIAQSECRQLGTATGATITQAAHVRFVVDRDCAVSIANPDRVGNALSVVRGHAVTSVATVAGRMSRDRSAILFDGAFANGNVRLRVQGFRG